EDILAPVGKQGWDKDEITAAVLPLQDEARSPVSRLGAANAPSLALAVRKDLLEVPRRLDDRLEGCQARKRDHADRKGQAIEHAGKRFAPCSDRVLDAGGCRLQRHKDAE